MKKFSFLLSLLAILALAACRPEPFKEIGPDDSLTEGVYGSWQLSGVQQTDLTQPVPETFDVSDYFTGDPMRVRFSEGGNYTVEYLGSGLEILGSSGSFAFDSPDFPSKMNVVTDKGDSLELGLSQMVRKIDNRMGLVIEQNLCDAPNIRYTLTFNRQ